MKTIDMHCDTIYEIAHKGLNLRENQLHIDLNKLMQADYLLQNFALFVPLKEFDEQYSVSPAAENPLKEVLFLADCYYRELEANKDIIAPVYTYEDIEKNASAGKISSMLTIEEGGVCLGSLEVLRILYRLGVRMMTLTWNFPNEIGYPNWSPDEDEEASLTKVNTKDGLTETGFAFLEEMERLGMIIDVSHLSDAGFYDVLSHTKKPFVASHSNARSVCGVARNLTDDMIKKLADRGGVTGLNFCADFLTFPTKGLENPGTIEAMVKHAKHITNVGGMDCLGLGSDFDGIQANQELPDASDLPKLYEALKKAGFRESELEKIFYKNVLRVYKDTMF